MITINVMGGLGNQLFQIFTLISYSIDQKNPFFFGKLNEPPKDRPYYWNNFLYKLKPFFKNYEINKQIREPSFHYFNLPNINSDQNIRLIGYYQSYKYFHDNTEIICKMINYKEQREKIKDKFHSTFFNNTVSLHFRIGDYKRKQHFHPVLTTEYYINALNKLIEKTNKKDWHILYFCEAENNSEVLKKINIIKEQFPEITFECVDHKLKDWEQLLVMTLCQHNIIANSTFSWWGAYLNLNENYVIYPNIWFGPKGPKINKLDLFPNEWIEVNHQ